MDLGRLSWRFWFQLKLFFIACVKNSIALTSCDQDLVLNPIQARSFVECYETSTFHLTFSCCHFDYFSLLSSKSTFSQPFKEKCISESYNCREAKRDIFLRFVYLASQHNTQNVTVVHKVWVIQSMMFSRTWQQTNMTSIEKHDQYFVNGLLCWRGRSTKWSVIPSYTGCWLQIFRGATARSYWTADQTSALKPCHDIHVQRSQKLFANMFTGGFLFYVICRKKFVHRMEHFIQFAFSRLRRSDGKTLCPTNRCSFASWMSFCF